MSNPIKKLAGQTAVYGLSSIVGRLLNYLLVPIYVTAFAATEDYGQVSDLYAMIAFLMVLLTFGMETAYFRFLHRHENAEMVFRNAFLSVIMVNLSFLLVIIIFHPWIADLLLYPENPEYIILFSLIVVVDAIGALPLAKLRANEKAGKFAVVQLTSIAVNIGLNLILMLLVFDSSIHPAEMGVRFILIANLVASLVKPALLYKDFTRLRWMFDFTLVRAMVRYSFPLAIAGLAFVINETIDRVLLKHVSYHDLIDEMGKTKALKVAESRVGIYSANYKLAMLVTIFLQAYRYAAEPFFFAQSNDENRNRTYVKVMNYFIAAIFLCFLGVSLNLDIFKYFIPNDDYWEGLVVVPILLLANVFSGIYVNQSIWYKLSGQTYFGALIAGGGAVLTIILNIIFIPIYGYMACAWVTFFVYGGQMVASYLLGQRHYPIPYNLRKFALYSIVALSIYGLLEWINIPMGWTQLLVHNALILLFVALVWFMEKPRVIKDQGI